MARDKCRFYANIPEDWRWTTRSANGDIVGGATEGYHNRGDALSNAERYQVLIPTDDPDVFEVMTLEEVKNQAYEQGRLDVLETQNNPPTGNNEA